MAETGGQRKVGDTPLWLRLAPAIFLLFWSAGFAFLKMGLAHAAPLTFLALRYALVLAVLAPLFVVLRPPLPRSRAAWGHLAAIGILIQALYFGLISVAIERGLSAGGAALIASLQPILVALLVPWFAGERVSARRWVGLGFGCLGATLVIVARSTVEATSTLSVLFAVGALASITAGTLYEKRFGVAHHPVTSNLVQYAIAFAATLPAAWAFEGLRVTWTGELFVALGYLVIANSLISMTLLLAMIRHGEAARVSALFFLVPPTAALIAWAVIGEAMPVLAWAGTALAALGVALATKQARAPAKRP